MKTCRAKNWLSGSTSSAAPRLDVLSEGLTIQELMAEDPLFFVSVICDVYLRAHRDPNEESVDVPCTTELEEARAEAGFRLLRGMRVIPGRNENGEIDESRLLRWINVARQRASDEDRAVMTDQTIGGVLAHVEEDPHDQVWPHRGVRHVIDELVAPEIERGIRLERFNMRGVYSKAVCEGGGQERELEAQYRGWAAALRSQWPGQLALWMRLPRRHVSSPGMTGSTG